MSVVCTSPVSPISACGGGLHDAKNADGAEEEITAAALDFFLTECLGRGRFDVETEELEEDAELFTFSN